MSDILDQVIRTGRTHRARWSGLAILSLTGMCMPVGCGGNGAAVEDPGRPATQHLAVEEPRVTIAGNTHPRATVEFDQGALTDDFALDHMQLVLRRSADRQAALTARIEAMQDPASPLYHQWLTAETFGQQYGLTDSDLATVTTWLTSQGFHVDNVPVERGFIEFSGTAATVRTAFRTEMHRLTVHGVDHIANMSDPQIPASLASMVYGVHALHDFFPHPMHRDRGTAHRDPTTGHWALNASSPDFTIVDGTSTYYGVAPADFATIYNLNPLFAAGHRGAGQTIAVIEDTNIKNVSDVTSFRTAFGLSGYAGTFTQIHPTGSSTCTVPAVNSAEMEAALDAEWAGAAAPDAAIELASCKDTSTVFGGLIAVQNLLHASTTPSVISISYGECEAENGATANQSYVNAYEEAAALGISVFVSAGDEGAASCDADLTVATHGISVSGFASTPYNVAVGGTDFADTYNNHEGGPALSTYWNATDTATYGSARSYIPEIPWNDSCASHLIDTVEGYTLSYGSTGFCNSTSGKANFLTTASGSGGPSAFSAQPAWQTGVVGLPTQTGGHRYLPDVSLFAANGVWGHFYLYCMSDTAHGGVPCTYTNTTDTLDNAAGGTSFAAPAMAGIQAIINQVTGARQGNPNPTYYRLAAAEYGATGSSACNSNGGTAAAPVLPASTCTFYDVTVGDMDVPCTGTTNCYGYSKSGRTTEYGVLSTSSTTLGPAYGSNVGWDYATGLGTINAANLVANW